MPDINDPMVFRKGDDVFCLRDFPFSGRPFKRGEQFPWRRMSVSMGKVQNMFNARYLTHADIDPPKDKDPELEGFELRHRGGVWFDVYRDGVQVNEDPLQGKRKAKAFIKELKNGPDNSDD